MIDIEKLEKLPKHLGFRKSTDCGRWSDYYWHRHTWYNTTAYRRAKGILKGAHGKTYREVHYMIKKLVGRYICPHEFMGYDIDYEVRDGIMHSKGRWNAWEPEPQVRVGHRGVSLCLIEQDKLVKMEPNTESKAARQRRLYPDLTIRLRRERQKERRKMNREHKANEKRRNDLAQLMINDPEAANHYRSLKFDLMRAEKGNYVSRYHLGKYLFSYVPNAQTIQMFTDQIEKMERGDFSEVPRPEPLEQTA